MNKSTLVKKIAEKANLKQDQAEAALNAFVASITEALQAGEKVQMIGFGTFEVKERAARTGHNPLNGQPMEISAKRIPSFKAGKAFKDVF